MTGREFEGFIFERFAKTIRSWRHGSDIYALSFFVYDEEDDSNRLTGDPRLQY
jgi:hypothetical protein